MPNSLTNDPNQLEDIFAETNTAPLAGNLDAAPVAEVGPVSGVDAVDNTVSTIPSSRHSRRWLLIATVITALLLLVAAGVAVWIWLQQTPTNLDTTNANNPVNQTDLVNTTNTNQVITNANEVANVNELVPENTNTNTVSFVDVDHDGLSDQEELVENTNPKKKDTDEDGLSDREEVRVYDTDPRNPDTDGDGYTDGDEVTHFYHPNSPDPKQRLFDLPQ